MRLTFLLLLLGNLLFYLWSAGYLGTRNSGHEAERLTQQIAPERLRLVSEDANLPPRPPGANVAKECQQVSGLSTEEVDAVEKILAPQSDVGTQRTNETITITLHWVLIGKFVTRAQAEKRLAELRLREIEAAKVVSDDSFGPFVISLGMFSTAAAAETLLASLEKKGVPLAKIERREQMHQKPILEIQAAPAFFATLPGLLAPWPGASTVPCLTQASQ